jgi:DNA-binding NtrC family response regulator
MKTLFFAEDYEDIRELVSTTLADELRCKVVPFCDGNSLMAALGNGTRPDLIVSDICMPNGSGLDVWAFLSDSALTVPVISYSSWTLDRIVDMNAFDPPARFVAKDDLPGLISLAGLTVRS